MDFGERVTQQRKKKGWSRDELAQRVGTSAAIVGRYERGEMKPSVEVAARIAAELGVSLDWLVGLTEGPERDQRMVYRLQLIEEMAEAEKERILYVLDALLQTARLEHTQVNLGR